MNEVRITTECLGILPFKKPIYFINKVNYLELALILLSLHIFAWKRKFY